MRTFTFLALALLFFGTVSAQNKKTNAQKKQPRYPELFSISKTDFDKLFDYKTNETLKTPANKYLDKSVLELNTLNGDMRLLRIKLNYFPKGIMMVQVNGVHSTQVFITTDKKELSYKGKIEKDVVTLTKCHRDDIYSE